MNLKKILALVSATGAAMLLAKRLIRQRLELHNFQEIELMITCLELQERHGYQSWMGWDLGGLAAESLYTLSEKSDNTATVRRFIRQAWANEELVPTAEAAAEADVMTAYWALTPVARREYLAKLQDFRAAHIT